MNLANFTLPPLDRHTWLHMVLDSFEDVQLHRYSPYFSDHDALCVTLTIPQVGFSIINYYMTYF